MIQKGALLLSQWRSFCYLASIRRLDIQPRVWTKSLGGLFELTEVSIFDILLVVIFEERTVIISFGSAMLTICS